MARAKIYIVDYDCNKYQYLQPEDRHHEREVVAAARAGKLYFDGIPKLPTWRPVKVYTLEPKRPIANICGFAGGHGLFAVDEVARAALEPIISIHVEFLPVNFKLRQMWIVHPLRCIDILDQKRSKGLRSDDGTLFSIDVWAFLRRRLVEVSLFTVPEKANAVLTIEFDRDPDHEFRAAVKHHKLTGLLFGKVWDSAKPPFRYYPRMSKP